MSFLFSLPHDRFEWIHTLANINNTPTQVQRGQRAIQNGNTHTFISNGTVYMIIWFPFSCFGRYVYLDFFFLNSLNSSLPELGLKLCTIIAVRKLFTGKISQSNLFSQLLCLHTLSLSLSSWTKTFKERCNKMAFRFQCFHGQRLLLRYLVNATKY